MKYFLQKVLAPIGVSPTLKRLLSVFAYAVVPIVGVALSVMVPSDPIFRSFGEWAQFGLIAILFMKPTAVIVPLNVLRRALTYRRQMGVTVFWLALFHGVGLMYFYGFLFPGDFLGWDNLLLYGGTAMLMMVVLGATSNDISVRFLRGNWKRIQYLAYPTLFLVLLHSSMFKGEMIKLFVVGGAFIILKFLEVRKFRLDAYAPILRKWGL